jgi:hypothetical protein
MLWCGKVCNLALLTLLLPLVFTPVVLLLAPPLRAPSPPPCPSGQKLVLDFDTHAVVRHTSAIVVHHCVVHRQQHRKPSLNRRWRLTPHFGRGRPVLGSTGFPCLSLCTWFARRGKRLCMMAIEAMTPTIPATAAATSRPPIVHAIAERNANGRSSEARGPLYFTTDNPTGPTVVTPLLTSSLKRSGALIGRHVLTAHSGPWLSL